MELKDKALLAVEALEKQYPDAICSLVYERPYELLISTRLAAQCTDARVNIVTEVLFDKYRSLEDFANAELADVENIVKSCGLYKTKAKDIIAMCKMLISDFDSTLPDTVEE